MLVMCFVCVTYTAECIGEWAEGQDCADRPSAVFDRVNHQEILYRLSTVGIRGSMLSILTQFLSNRSQFVLVDGCHNKLVNVVSGVPQGSVLGSLLFLLYTSELFSIQENKLIGYADDSTLMVVVPSPGARVMAAESLNRDLVRVNASCDFWYCTLESSVREYASGARE